MWGRTPIPPPNRRRAASRAPDPSHPAGFAAFPDVDWPGNDLTTVAGSPSECSVACSAQATAGREGRLAGKVGTGRRGRSVCRGREVRRGRGRPFGGGRQWPGRNTAGCVAFVMNAAGTQCGLKSVLAEGVPLAGAVMYLRTSGRPRPPHHCRLSPPGQCPWGAAVWIRPWRPAEIEFLSPAPTPVVCILQPPLAAPSPLDGSVSFSAGRGPGSSVPLPPSVVRLLQVSAPSCAPTATAPPSRRWCWTPPAAWRRAPSRLLPLSPRGVWLVGGL